MKKLKDLKENECIKISTRRELRKIAKKAEQQEVALVFEYLPIKTYPVNGIVEKTGWIGGNYNFNRAAILPASDFIRPSVKEQIKQLRFDVDALKVQAFYVNEPETVLSEQKEYNVSEPYNRAAVAQAKLEENVLSELPEKWAILAGKNSIVHHWFNDKLNRQVYIADEPFYFHLPQIEEGVCTCSKVQNGYTEITFAQFEKWVLGETVELEAGKWFIYPDGAMMYNTKDGCGFGINMPNSIWIEKARWLQNYENGTDYRQATRAEVEAALIGEAKRRGYAENNYRCLAIPDSTYTITNNDYFLDKSFRLYHGRSEKNLRGNLVFENGQWAEVVKPAEKEIDWSYGRLFEYVSMSSGLVVMIDLDSLSDDKVKATCIQNKSTHTWCRLGENRVWKKSNLKPFTGQITLNAKD